MNNEVSTAVKLGVSAIWIVLNDLRYNMCEQGMAVLGLEADAGISGSRLRDVGAGDARRWRSRQCVRTRSSMERWKPRFLPSVPFVLDVRIDPTRPAPSMAGNRGLRALGRWRGAPCSKDAFCFRPGRK